MKSPLPLELVLAISFCLNQFQLPLADAAPKESPTPSPAVSPSQSSPAPSASPRKVVFPIPSAAPTRAPEKERTSSFPVTPPKPGLPLLPPPPVAAPAPFHSGPLDLQRSERAIPQIQVWRNGSDLPQIPKRRARARFGPALIAGNEPVTIELRFHRSLAGKLLSLLRSEGVALQPAHSVVQIGATGEGALIAQLETGQRSGQIGFEIDGVTILLRLVAAPEWAVEKAEKESGQ